MVYFLTSPRISISDMISGNYNLLVVFKVLIEVIALHARNLGILFHLFLPFLGTKVMYIVHHSLIEAPFQFRRIFYFPQPIVSWDWLTSHRKHKTYFLNFHPALWLFKGISFREWSHSLSDGAKISQFHQSSWPFWKFMMQYGKQAWHATEVQQNLKGNYKIKICSFFWSYKSYMFTVDNLDSKER